MMKDFKHTKIAIVGIGALGGMTAHELVRMGVKKLILIDADTFSESNFNRQLYADSETIHQAKAEVTRQKLLKIASDLEIEVYLEMLDAGNGSTLIRDAEILVDCVDNVETKLLLEQLAENKNIPLVHGAVDGEFGQAAVIYPGERTLSKIYQDKKASVSPTFVTTVNIVASLQVNAIQKIMTHRLVKRNGIYFIDLQANDLSFLDMGKN